MIDARRVFPDTPLWSAGHLPHKEGEQPAARLSTIIYVTGKAVRLKLPISPLEGEMAGRPEGGGTERERSRHEAVL
jgi:hypothetical protein